MAVFLCCGALVARAATTEQRVKDLLAQMTLEEKVGQLVQYSSRDDMTGAADKSPFTAKLQAGGMGSMLNVVGASTTRRWQKIAVEGSRLRIPLLFGLDVIHGYRTIFPIPLATAASWDLAKIEEAERIAAREAAAAGLHWTFAPMVDIARDPRWGRIAEGAGEDPFLGSAIARARVRGFQGDNSFSSVEAILACAKHFAAYGAAQAGRDYFTTDVTERQLREVYLPPFEAAVKQGVGTLMSGFNDVDGTPASGSSFLMTQVLRREWGFKGFVVSDWASVKEMIAHGSAADLREATAQGFLAGVDMDMQSEGYGPYLAELVRSGRVPMARLDAAVAAVLTMKFRLGLFDDPYRFSDEAREKSTLLAPEHLEAARDLARRSCVLLKNDGLLPLQLAGKRVALLGPLADARVAQLGTWHARGQGEDTVTLRMALEQALPPGSVTYARGCGTDGDDRRDLPAAIAAAQAADVVIVAVGEDHMQSGESMSRAFLDFSGPQRELLRQVRALGKPTVLVVMAGRPLLLEEFESGVNAILVGWHPGTMGGPALVDVLTGAYNPSGKLPISWPRSVGQIPIFYAHKNSGRPGPKSPTDHYYSRYIDSPSSPHFAFGFGLSYTSFGYDGLVVSAPVMKAGAPLQVQVRVSNTGARAGEEVVQLYVRDRVGSVTRPVRELKGFEKLALQPGESRVVTFTLHAADLAFWRADRTWGAEPGDFDVFVGGDSNAALTASFKLE